MRRFKHLLTDGSSPWIKNGFNLTSLDNIVIVSENGESQKLSEYLVMISAMAGRAAGTEAEDRIAALEEILDIPSASGDGELSITTPNILTLTGDLTFSKPAKEKWVVRLYLEFTSDSNLFWEGEEQPFLTGTSGQKKSAEIIKFGEGKFSLSIKEII